MSARRAAISTYFRRALHGLVLANTEPKPTFLEERHDEIAIFRARGCGFAER
jgi:hypothetical protein